MTPARLYCRRHPGTVTRAVAALGVVGAARKFGVRNEVVASIYNRRTTAEERREHRWARRGKCSRV
jgi:hypothetical protein